MTSIEWLAKQLLNAEPNVLEWQKYILQAKEMHKQEIIDAYYQCGRDNFEHIKVINRSATEYYQETFVSKGSDDHISDISKMVEFPQQEKTLSDKWKEYQDWLNEIPEISDEEIEGAARTYTFDEYQKVIHYETYDTYNDFVNGAKWYREQLKQRQ